MFCIKGLVVWIYKILQTNICLMCSFLWNFFKSIASRSDSVIQEILFTQTVGEVKLTEAKITNLWDVYPCSSQPYNPVLSCCKQPSPAVPHCFLSNSQVTLQTFKRELHPQCFRNLDEPLYIFHSGTNPRWTATHYLINHSEIIQHRHS